MIRVGIGQDSHSFSKSKPLILGGVKISKVDGLKGNSDGDVILHSLCNALSSAIGGDSLGTWADEMLTKQNITNSIRYAEYILKKIRQQKYLIENISISIEAKKPYFSKEVVEDIKKSLATVLKITKDRIGITFTSGDALSSFGKGKGIQALTIVSIRK